MEGAVVIKLDTEENSETLPQTSPSPDEGSTSSNGKATEPSGRKTPDTPGSDTPTTGNATPTPNALPVGNSEGESSGDGSESAKTRRKALAILGIDEEEETRAQVSSSYPHNSPPNFQCPFPPPPPPPTIPHQSPSLSGGPLSFHPQFRNDVHVH